MIKPKNINNNSNIVKEEKAILKGPKQLNIIPENKKIVKETDLKKEDKPERIKKTEEQKKTNINTNNKNNNINDIKINKVEEKEKSEKKQKEDIKKKNNEDKININKKNSINIEKEKENKNFEEPKKVNNIITNKQNNMNSKKEEKPKENEPRKSNIVLERLKMINASNNNNPPPKRQEKVKFKLPNEQKPKEENSKPNKNISAQNNIKPSTKEEPKRINKFLEKNNIVKEEPIKSSALKNKFTSGFADKLKQMNDFFKNQSQPGGQKRGKSVMVKSTKLGFGPKNDWKDSGNNNLDIIREEPDKMKPGYDPAANLEKTLNDVVVNKRKRKMTRAVFKG